MFKNSGKSNAGPGSARRGSFSVLGAEVTVTGDITATDLHLEGRAEGDVSCGSLVLGNSGHIAGSVTAESARIAGSIAGPVSVRELTVERTARIAGDIAYQSITIETGARVEGQLRRIDGEIVASDAPLILEARPEDPLRLFSAEEAAA